MWPGRSVSCRRSQRRKCFYAVSGASCRGGGGQRLAHSLPGLTLEESVGISILACFSGCGRDRGEGIHSDQKRILAHVVRESVNRFVVDVVDMLASVKRKRANQRDRSRGDSG